MSELKPCPFCGGAAKFAHIFENPEKCMVSCRECDGGIDAVFADEEKAIAAWNRRAQPANKEKGKYAMDTESKRIFDDLYALHDHYDEDPQHMICAEAADYIKNLSEMLERRAQPANEPLTLDELREMDGEPVWIPIPDGSGYGDWAIVDIGAQTELLKAVDLDVAHEECNYGKTWLAYRRKPEGSKP